MKSDLIKKILIGLLLISINISFFQQVYFSEVYYNPLKDENLKLNAPEITIITPENVTYTKPMSGYYLGTYGFENDDNDAIPQEWIDNSGTSTYVKVISGIGGHYKTLECYSSSDYDSVINLRNYYNPQITGTVEFWWRKNSNYSSRAIFRLYGVGGDPLIGIAMDDVNIPDKILFVDSTGASVDTGYPYADDRWIHMRIEFNCTSDLWSLWIDSVQYLNQLNFWSYRVDSAIDRTHFGSFAGGHPTLYYVDAVSYSWDPNNNVGDNLNEGLLLSFESSIDFDWLGYSLDGQANKTILGNSTFPFPDVGLHTIQVFGNDSMGGTYESDIRYFFVGVEEPSPSGIHGYDLWILIGIISIASIIIISKKRVLIKKKSYNYLFSVIRSGESYLFYDTV